MIQYEKLKMYRLISSCIPYGNGAIITISDTAKTYKDRKEEALKKQEEQERRQKLETDYLHHLGVRHQRGKTSVKLGKFHTEV